MVTYKIPLQSLGMDFLKSLEAIVNLSSVFIQTATSGKINLIQQRTKTLILLIVYYINLAHMKQTDTISAIA